MAIVDFMEADVAEALDPSASCHTANRAPGTHSLCGDCFGLCRHGMRAIRTIFCTPCPYRSSNNTAYQDQDEAR